MKQIDEMIARINIDTSSPSWKTRLSKPEPATFDPAKRYWGEMVTSKGAVKIAFFPDVAPMHVTSFFFLAKLGFFDGLTFHRVIPEFMAQGGCPLGNGTGGPGYKFAGECSPKQRHDRPGLLSQANAGPNTDGSQFFLTFVPTPWLDDKHTIFGEVVEGIDTLKALEAAGSRSGMTKENLTIEKVTVWEE